MNVERDPQVVDVGTDEWCAASGNSILETRGLGPCVGIASYDLATRTGHMLHTTNPHLSPKLLDAFFESVAKKAKDTETVVFYVRGGQPEPGSHDAMTEEARTATLARLKEFGGMATQADVEWLDNPEGVVDIELDTMTGKFKAESTTVPELLALLQL
jgi:hypothetical protein